MTGPTHKQYSVTFVCVMAMIMYTNGIFVKEFNTSNTNYYLAVLLMLPIAKIGARFPDWDTDWEFVKDKTVVSRVINLLIHLTGGKHRSWQTHSIDIVVACTVASAIVPYRLMDAGLLSYTNKVIMQLMLLALMSGWISHMFSDMLNGVGVRLFFWCTFRIAFVPKKFLWLKFNTGEAWESFNFFVIRKINIVLGILTLVYPYMLW